MLGQVHRGNYRELLETVQYSSTVEGSFRANTQFVVKEQGFMRASPQVDVREQVFVRVSPQVKVGIGTNPPVNVGM